ncbi:hypothetical protein LFAB_10310 [Lactiplantibacillus fabifermentans T30PCM01]|uniref:Uncharacterized protein n=1 Tax=Lactiplantibacillus fabifermentans T30PCM01 TaxID=1400520 RepID=W6TC71_9LACO|nr:hypothetical protein LFAB_10310 [Lactiplantibacillus fabifermentans T30PCM01]
MTFLVLTIPADMCKATCWHHSDLNVTSYDLFQIIKLMSIEKLLSRALLGDAPCRKPSTVGLCAGFGADF